MTSRTASPLQQDVFSADVVVLTPAWRALAAALKVFARGGLLMIGAALLFSDNPPNPLEEIRSFAALFLAPEAAAWCIRRAFTARLRLENGTLRLDRRAELIEVPVAAITGVEPWRLLLPGVGVDLRLEEGKRLAQGLSQMLGQESAQAQQQGGMGGDLMTALLDQDGDGKVDMNDLMQLGSKLLGGRR